MTPHPDQAAQDAAKEYVSTGPSNVYFDGDKAHKESFLAGVRYRDENPSEEVMALVEAAKEVEAIYWDFEKTMAPQVMKLKAALAAYKSRSKERG